MQPRAETYEEGRLLGLSEAIRQLDRILVQQMSDARLLKGETLAVLAKSGMCPTQAFLLCILTGLNSLLSDDPHDASARRMQTL